ncbi:MAG: HEAT repeat domain-containing protein, partial [Planctomycetaceae bacterium]
INLDAAELLGERLNGLISLKPQQIVVLDAGSLGLAVTQERANAFDARTPRRLIAPAGKYSVQLEATFNNILHWERGQDKVLAKDAWVGTLQTGAAPLTIVTAPPDGLGFLKPYPKLHGLSLDMTEPQFLEIVKQQELKTRKTVEGEKVTHHIALGDDHTLIVMFDKDAKCSGIQRVRGEDDALTRPEAKIGKEKTRTVAKDQIEFPIQVVTNDGRPVVGAKVQLWAYRTSSGSPLVDSQWSPETTTDAAGTARVVILKELFKIMALVETPRKNGIPKILGLNLRVEHPQYPTWSQSVEVANPIRVVLAEPATIEVRAHRENDAELLREVMPVFSSYAGSSSEWLAMKEQSQKEGVLTIRRVDLTSKQAARWLRLVHVPKEGPAWFSELIDLKPLQPPISLNVAMQPGVRVAGRLPDTVPRPVVNGRVAAQVVSGGSDASRNWSWSMGTTITKDGSFVLDSVPANENLQLIAVCDGWVSRSPTVDEMADYARTHSFETKYSGASAESVHPRLFRTIAPGIEPLLPMEATTDCEVTVVDESGQPIADALVAFSPNQHWFHGGSIGLGMSHDSLKSLQTVFQTGSPLKSDMTNERFNATTDARGKAVIANLPAANTDPASPAMHLLRVLHANYDAPIEPRFYGQRIQLVELHPGQSGRVTVRMTPAKRNFAKETGQANPKLQSGLEFLKPYPKLHGLSLDMTEPQFLEIVKQQQQLKSHKTVEGEKVTHYIGLGDGHTLIVMFDKDAKCSGIRRVHGADQLGKDDDDKTPIVEIVIEGNDTIDSAEIRKRIEQPIGEPASDSQIRKDVRAVFGTRWFYSVMPVYRRTEGGLVLVFIVVERPKSERVAVSSPSNIERDHQKVVDALDEVGSIEFANVRLHKVLDVFRRYWPNVAIQVDPLAEAAMQTQVSFQTKGDEFEYVLAAALDQAKLSYCVHSVWLVVGTADEIRGRGYAVPESFSELITKLKQVDDGIRWERILRGTVEAADLAALPKVLKLLEHTQPVVQREALRVLLRFGDRAGSAQSATLKLTDSKDRSVRRVAWRAFAATGLNDPQTLPRIVQAWNAGHQEVRHDLWDLVALFGNDDAPMRIVFEHGTPELRQHLMRSIGDPDEYQHGLVMLGLNDGQPATRAAALQHGLQRARYSEPLVRQLKRMQQDADPLCRVLAAGHLLKLADSYSAALALLIAEGSKDNAPEEVRTVALSAFEWLSLEIGQKVSQSLEEARRTATSEKATEFCRQAMSIIARRKMQIENSRAGDSPKDIGADDKALRGQIRWVDQATGSAWINLGEADSVTKRMIFKVREKGTVELTRIVDGNTSVVRIVRDDLANPIAKGDEIVFLELAPAAGSGNPRRAPLDRIVSLKASDRPQELADVLKEVCRQAEVEFEIDDAELQKDRSLHAMPMIVDEEAVRGPLGFVLSQVLNPVLAFELVDQKLRVSTRQKLKGNRFEADHIDLAKLAESAGPTLTSLRLCGTRATDDDLRHLAKFPKLERLDLTSTAISDAGMEHVARLESLTTLRLGDFVTDAGLKTLTASRSIRTLALLGSPVTDAAAESLVQMSALETLTIQWANFGDAGAKRLAAADRLKHLVLYVRTLTDEGAGALATCQKLERLSLLGARLTVGSLKALEKMRSLRDLEIGFPNISESDVKPLRTALAKTRIRQTRIAPPDPRSADGHVFDAETGRILEMFRSQFGHPDPVTGEIEWEPLREHYLAPNVTGRFGVSSLQPFRKFRVIADGYEPVEITALLLPGDDPRNHEMKIQMRRAKKKVAETKPPDGLEFLKPYPKLHGLSLDMTEPQFLEIVKQQELKTRKTVEGEKVTHHIALGDGHTLIVMFDKDAKCGGIQRVLGGQ